MAVWTLVPRDSGWFGNGGDAWVADMGRFLGAVNNDLLPPAVLPVDCAELDFIISYPNGDPVTASYPFLGGAVAVSLRDVESSGNFQYADVFDPVNYPDIDLTEPLHLWVRWWGPDYADNPPQPYLTPEQVVPCIYVRGGRGPYFGSDGVTLRCCPNQKLRTITIQRETVPGSWSDWQPGYAVTGSGAFTSPTTGTGNGGVRSASVDIDHRNAAGGGGTTAEELPYAPHDLRDLGAQVLLAARAAAPSDGSVRGVVYVTGTKLGQYGYQSFGPLAAHFEWSAYVAFAQEYTQFRLPDNALPDHPAPLAAGGLPGNRPDGSPGWQWEAPTLTDVHWNNLPVTQYGYSTSSGIFLQDPAAVYDAATYTFTVPVEYFAAPGNTLQSGTWVDLTGAVKIGELNLQFGLKSGSYIGGPNSYQSTPVSGTLDLSGVDFAEMMIVAQAKAVRTGGAELFRDVSEIPQTGSRNSLNAYSYDMVADIYVTHGNGDIGGELFGFSGPGPGYVTYTAQTPRWRYWIPGDPNVEIPTCVARQGGHWGVPLGDFSGARLTQLRKP